MTVGVCLCVIAPLRARRAGGLVVVADGDGGRGRAGWRRWGQERKRRRGDQRRKGDKEAGAVNYNKVMLIGCIKILTSLSNSVTRLQMSSNVFKCLQTPSNVF